MICLDTSPVIWAIQNASRAGADPLVTRAAHYIQRAGEALAIPAPVLLEYLAGLPVDRHAESLRILEGNFLIPAFDTKAACVAAEIQADRARFRAAADAAGRQPAKFDVAVLATAIACGATELLTNDTHVVDLANNRIKVVLVRDVPLPAPTLPFPDGGESPSSG
jgi:predicted nucleic acid-binding protein